MSTTNKRDPIQMQFLPLNIKYQEIFTKNEILWTMNVMLYSATGWGLLYFEYFKQRI